MATPHLPLAMQACGQDAASISRILADVSGRSKASNLQSSPRYPRTPLAICHWSASFSLRQYDADDDVDWTLLTIAKPSLLAAQKPGR